MHINSYFIFLFIFVVCHADPARVIKCMFHSSFKDDSSNLIHISATSQVDVIHYLWSSFQLPSVIVLRTTKDTDLKFDLEKQRLFQKGAMLISKEPLASTGLTITELWQDLYTSDTSDIKDIDKVVPLSLDTFEWKNITNSSFSCSNNFASINLIASATKETEEIFSAGGTFEIEFSVSGSETPASEYPHLIYTGNSTQIKAVFNNFYSNSSRVRYAMEMSVFAQTSSECVHENCDPVITQSVSDEFSPGIFSDISLIPICSKDSFLSWRPVAYISKLPTVANSTDAEMTSDCTKSIINTPRSIAELFFSEMSNISVGVFNMTFGAKGDGFYGKTKYAMWSFMVGVGTSIGFKVSLTAIIFASVGIASLFVFIIGGLIFVSIQRCRKKKNDEKELLSSPVN